MPMPVHISARWKMLPGARTAFPASMLFVYAITRPTAASSAA